MSALIEQIIDVLEYIKTHHKSNPTIGIRYLRIEAVREISFQRRVDDSTVADKYIRWLNPPVKNTADFDRLLKGWLREGSDELQNILLKYSKSNHDRERVKRFFLSAQASPTPVAKDIDEPSQPARVKQEVYRILRDTARAREIKAAHQYKCQLCSSCLMLSDDTPYAEAHHIKPLGKPHNGPDIGENIICVCPNCHVLLDYGSIQLDPNRLKDIDIQYINYHNSYIYGMRNKLT